MKTYELRVLYYTGQGSSYLARRIKAEGFTTAAGYFSFYDSENKTVFVSPLNLTIIDKISE